jgi:hypothetical protein
LVTTDLAASFTKHPSVERKKFGCKGFVDKKGFHRVTNTRPLALSVEGNPKGHVQIRVPIHIHVADAVVVLNHRNPRVTDNPVNQTGPSPWNDQIN